MNILPNEFWEFYKVYLGEHRNHLNRILHHIGTLLSILFVLLTLVTRHPVFILWALAAGYGFAWIGHFFIEKNKPTSFSRPFYSLLADFVMLYDLFRFELDKKIREL
jgi:hypothetical protein